MALIISDRTNFVDCYVWDVNTLSWVKMTQPGAGGGGASTIADGADVAQGTTTDVAWSSGAGTVIALLKKIAGGASTNITQFGGSNVTLGQQVAGSSLPVILPSATVTTLTPPAAITGFALEAGHLATIDTSTAKIPAQGQALSAASMPVVLPATQITTLTPPAAITGFALEAGHLATIDTSTAKIPSQGQALAAASMPVVLPATQITTLTPPAAITGFALEAGHLATIDAHLPAQGQALSANSLPVVLPATQITTLTPPAAITGFALEAGHLATIDTSTAKIPAQGQALAAASLPVVLTAAQVTTLTPPTTVTVQQGTGTNLHVVVDTAPTTAVTGTFWQTTQPVSISATVKTDGSSVTQPVSGTVTANAGTNLNTSTLALETGGNLASLYVEQRDVTNNLLRELITEMRLLNYNVIQGLSVSGDIDAMRSDPYFTSQTVS